MTTEETIQHQLATNPIILYMKGIPSNPQCGFSGKAVGILNATKIPFSYVNVLEAPFIREKLPKISHWPTYPQLFVKGELVGGCDILEAMSIDGSLLLLLESTIKTETHTHSDTITSQEVIQLVQAGLPMAQVIVDGVGCDLLITVISAQFAELSLVKKQQLVMMSLIDVLESGRLHAVSIKTYTPEEWHAQSAKPELGLLQIQL